MLIEVFKSKIHRVKVTESDLNYIGSITIDEDLIDAAGLVVGERVYIVNVNNGERFDTYVIKGKRNSGEICLNGPAARKVHKGDVIIIIAYAQMTPEEAQAFQPKIVFPNEETNLLT
ncbi:aspartate 1-decarboxylase [Elizabethkingia occulta]|uniref:Aspartate 1-decarboxylase n=1 Tax=Elizabethkingia occulta TaxID=1867263 RepID=A0A1T3ML07_9FLAO|nr:aspartate 1-decarboxylase [Elizabethkingia occulta]OPB91381.1 aspartate 1-decarboxylase [Elizabethkingia occulta]OPC65318.1 aspartate 1-decarboxylase [Elizabethkingia occulta]